jgi:hypothetical protein
LPKGVSDSLTPFARDDLGARLQGCGFAAMLGAAMRDAPPGFGPKGAFGPGQFDCVASALGRPEQRQLIAGIVLDKTVRPGDALSFARLLMNCVDLGSVVASSSGLDLSAAERSCITEFSRADEDFLEIIAAAIRGESTAAVEEAAGRALFPCLTPDHQTQIAGRPQGLLS